MLFAPGSAVFIQFAVAGRAVRGCRPRHRYYAGLSDRCGSRQKERELKRIQSEAYKTPQEIKGTTDSMVQGAKDAAKKIEDIWKGTRQAIELGTKTPSAIPRGASDGPR